LQGWHVNLGEVHVHFLLSANASDLDPVDDGKIQQYGEQAVNAALRGARVN
jgi:hypothetical protein